MILDEILANKRLEVAARRASRPESTLTPSVTPPRGFLRSARDVANLENGQRTSALSASDSVNLGNGPRSLIAQDAVNVANGQQHASSLGALDAAIVANGPQYQPLLLQGRRERSEASNAPSHSGVKVIAEIKRRSPSGGMIRPDLTPSDLARIYAQNGAAALSVLTDEKYFGGSDADLVEARAACDLPVLRKDFVVDAYQLHEARSIGADAVLLIVRALPDAELSALLALAQELGLDALVEAHSEDEVRRALDAGARIVGVNNRDLDTLQTDVSLAPRLRPIVPSDCVFVAESGISNPEQIATLADAGVDAVLIGEALLRAPDPGARLAELVTAGTRSGVHA